LIPVKIAHGGGAIQVTTRDFGRTMTIKRLLGPGLALLVAAGLLTALWMAFLRPVAVAVAGSQRDVAVQVFGLGTVEARIASKAGFKIGGVLTDLRADLGDRIARGAVLARLDDREQAARVARAEAAVQQAEASLQKAGAGLEKVQVNYANAKRINERRQKLVQTNVTSVESAESAEAAEDAARADVDLATSDIAVARANVSDAKAQLRQEQAALDFHTLTAPYEAMVIGRLKELGSALGAGEPVLALIDPGTIWVLAYIDESKAGEIRVGQPAEIVLRSLPGERFKGKVARIQPESDRVNEERRVEVAFNRIPDNASLGEQAEVYITTVRLAQALLVPESAIIGLGRNSGTVWTVEDGSLRQREVTLGHRLLDGRYEVTGGVPEGAKVAITLGSGLRAGRAARIASEPAP